MSKKQTSIAEVLQQLQNLQNKQRVAKDAALGFEYGLSLRAANHNISGNFVECVIDLVTTSIKDSPTVKEIKMHHLKSSYILHEAIAPNLRSKVMECNLEKHSILKNRNYMETGEVLGMMVKHVPRFVDVRFRYVPLLAKYMIENDRPLYVYYSELYRQVFTFVKTN